MYKCTQYLHDSFCLFYMDEVFVECSRGYKGLQGWPTARVSG